VNKPLRGCMCLCLVALCATAVFGTEVEKKWRFSFAAGGFNTDDNVPSQSGNILTLLDADEKFVDSFRDPRSDSAAFGDLGVDATQRFTLSGQYAFHRFFLIEASVGYQTGDVGDVEVQAQFDFQRIPTEKDFDFQNFRFKAGEMEQIPVQVSLIGRFRPRASFNPFVTAGVGYTVVGFEPDAELNALSANIDASTGGFAPFAGFRGFEGFAQPQVIGDLSGAFVDARDTFTWHIGGGAELDIKNKWSTFLDFRYIWASRSISIGFNGDPDGLGVAVPLGGIFEDSVQFADLILAQSIGAVSVRSGGLVDGGQLLPQIGAPPGTDCAATPNFCEFVFEPDGELDLGLYYVQGGQVNLGGLSLQFGFRYTF